MEDEKSGYVGDNDVVDFVSNITDAAVLRIEENLHHGFVRLKVAEAERRQARHDIRSVEDIVVELLRNSRDAGAKNILVGFQKEQGRYRHITVLDDGCGIPEDMHRMVFEPRVTSKSVDFDEDRYGVHGRGMALFSIRSRVDNARILTSAPGRGTAICLTVDIGNTPERSDQTTLPRLEMKEGRLDVGAGPHNVPRVLLEMSVDSPGIDFYIGSFAEILSTLRSIGGEGEPIWSEATGVSDARELAGIAGRVLGIPVSERNAYRILNGEIEPLEPVSIQSSCYKLSESGKMAVAPVEGRGAGTGRNPVRRLSREDLSEIGELARVAVDRVMRRYFLKTVGVANVRRGYKKITVSLYVGEEEEE